MQSRNNIFITSQELSKTFTNRPHLPKECYFTRRVQVIYTNFVRVYNDYDDDRDLGFNASEGKNVLKRVLFRRAF